MDDRQPKLFLLRVAFMAAFFAQVVCSSNSTSTSFEIFASDIDNSTMEIRFSDNFTLVGNYQIAYNPSSFEIKGLHPGTLYNITAANSSGAVETWILSTRPLPPYNITTNVIGTNVSIGWEFDDLASGKDGWKINYSIENASTGITTNTTSIQLTLQKDGTKYEVKIWTLAYNMTSETSLSTFIITYPNALSNANVTTNGRNITVIWKTRNSFNYTVCLTNVSTCSEKKDTNTHTFTNQVAGKPYTVSITVHAYERNSSEYKKIIMLPPLPPTNVSLGAITTTTSEVKWSLNQSLSLGDKWSIQYRTGSNKFENKTSTNKSIELTSLDPGEKYEVRVWTLSNNVSSETYANTSFVTVPVPLSAATLNATGKQITVTWKLLKNSTYTVCLVNINKCNKTQNTNTLTFDDLIPGTEYNVSIVHAYEKNSSQYTKTVVLPPLAPTNVSLGAITTNTSEIKWSLNQSLSLGDKWSIQYRTDSNKFENKTSTNKSIELTSLESGEKYEVRVWTLSNNVSSKTYANTSFVTDPKAVSTLTMETKERNITVTWTKVKQFSYTVCLTNIYKCVKKTPKSTYTFPNLVAGMSYNVSIIVHAYERNSSEYKDIIILPPLPPTNVTKHLINNKLFMEWYIDSNISVASEWHIEYTTENNTSYLNTSIRNSTLDLESGKEYEIKIWSISLNVKSNTSLIIIVNTAPEEVLSITSNEDDSQLILSWSPPFESMITHYKVGYSELCSKSPDCSSCTVVNPDMRNSRFNNVIDSNDASKTENTSYAFLTKPGCCYSTIIWAFNNNIKGKPAYFECRTRTFAPPVEKNPDNIKLTSTPTYKSFTVTLKKNPFKETKGPIINYNIIIATDKNVQHTKEKYFPNWKRFKNDESIKAYQIFKNCSNLYEKSNACSNPNSKAKRSLDNAVEYSIGTEYCEDEKDYCNGPLTPNTEYYIKIRAYTFDQFADTDYSSPIKTDQEKMEGYLIAIIVIIVLLISVVVVGMVLYVLRRRKTKPKPVVDSNSPYIMKPTSHPVRAAGFEAHFTQMSADTDYRFAEEFESLKEVGKHNQTLAAHLLSNRIKNRFVNILPYDFSRVKLSKSGDDDDEGSDYINANYIPGFTSQREYIATQGPLSSTRDDFWRMIWEQNVHNIVMLANCIEKYREKCDHYWPDNDETRCYGNIKVEKLNETITADWTITEFLVSNRNNVTRHLYHFHFTSWPDFGVPSSPQAIVMFVRIVREKLQNIGPLVIHCSAGVGRTGTFISVDRSLQDLEKNKEVDVLRVVHEMRQHRTFMVQTEEQYIYIHRCILHAIKRGNKDDIYENESYIDENLYENFTSSHVNKAFLYDDEGIHVDSP